VTAADSSSAEAPQRRRTAPARGPGEVPLPADRREAVMSVGSQLRDRRKKMGLSLRQFARDLGVSPSFISQIENGKSQPSVGTLYMICSALDLSIDELFGKTEVTGAAGAADPAAEDAEGSVAEVAAPADAGPEEEPGTHTFSGALARLDDMRPDHANPVVTPSQRRRLVLDSGVTWEQLSSALEGAIDFMFVRYDVGGSSVPDEKLTRHAGIEYGYIISGTLEIVLGFKTYQVGAGESISFDSSTPHRLTNRGDVPVEAIWFVHGRNPTHEH
jgi:transcriptional regulator with XRE-family HTH domain/mannose-6-phosphate isomerase-like protein (cupin superfamily)